MFRFACAVALLWISVAAQPSDLRNRVENYTVSREQSIVKELIDLLSIPNVASDREHIRRNATLLRDMLARRGFAAETLETEGNPLVYGERRVPGATRTILFYAHYDGQPVHPPGWQQSSPFVPILRDGRLEDGGKELPNPIARDRYEPDWRIYARSASDDKSPIVALVTALDALNAAGLTPTSNLRVILDGEEEAGSESLVPAIAKYRDKLAADAMFILDGPIHPSGRPTIVYGARGIVSVQLTVYGPKFALHSGHYGNWAPNPAHRLTRLLASMKDDEGRVLVEGFYDGVTPLTTAERRLLDAVPDDPQALKSLFGIAAQERADRSLQDALQIPTLNIRGMASAFVGEGARTVIPATATAEIDIRLVQETPAARMVEKLRGHIAAQGFHIVSDDPDDATRTRHERVVKMRVGDGTEAYRTSPLLPISRRAADAVSAVWNQPPVAIRTSGGTVPIAPFIAAMGFPAMSVPIVNFDNNQHSENENLRLGHFFKGIVTIAAILTM